MTYDMVETRETAEAVLKRSDHVLILGYYKDGTPYSTLDCAVEV